MPPRKFSIPGSDAVYFSSNGPAAFYYIIRSRNGGILSMSSNVPAEKLRGGGSPEKSVIGAAPDVSSLQASSGALREFMMRTPPGESLLVGRSIEPDLAELRQFGWTLAGIGGIVLLCGLAGGWVLASRAIRPIEDISATAVKIAAGDLSQRIDAADTDNELGRLATVLNSTFARLEAAFAQQGQFTADAAHELRTPVSVLLMQTQTALKHERDSAEYRACIEACQRAAQRMRGLLESLLELARLDAGQEPMKKMRFDFSNTVAECVEMVRPLAHERNVQIETESPPLEWTGDKERLAQVITNLLTNAIHYNKDGGEVRVETHEQNHEAVITVSDTGMGIAETDLPRIFERFYRADKSRSNAKGRTGLGLAISKAIVEAHGGSIEVASQPGKGTTFTVRLPARD
ncbi:MAG TPA: ATP-binding protein, partial [Verrucomicrobiae bacterium]|nr:ATP-binding protein [Verrucomicrobiae bacterium]